MVKGGYLDNSKSVHEFIKHFLDALVHIHDNEAREKYYSQVCFLVCSYSAFKSNEWVFDKKMAELSPLFLFLH
jgi:hypothetical protein